MVYQALYGEEAYWVRPEKMFFEQITRDGRTFNRFTEIDRKDGNIQRRYIRRPTGIGRFLRHMVPAMQDDAPYPGAGKECIGRPHPHHQGGCR